MESMVHILGAFPDTLVLNVYPTDQSFEIEERRVDPLLQEELLLLKEQAQELEEDFPTRFAFNGASLLMRAKGGDGFNYTIRMWQGSIDGVPCSGLLRVPDSPKKEKKEVISC